MYKQAIFMGLTFPTNKGVLSISQLPNLSINDLAASLTSLNTRIKQTENTNLDFLDETKHIDTALSLQFEILKDVYITKVNQIKNNEAERAAKKQNQIIVDLIQKKKIGDLESKSISELEKLLIDIE